MAVVRIKAGKQWFRRAALEADKTMPRAARELRAAIDRPGRMAELTLEEVTRLEEFMPGDVHLRTAVRAGELAQINERARHSALQAYLQRRRQG